MGEKSKEEKEIDFAIKAAFKKQPWFGNFLNFSKGFRAGILYQKRVIAKENEKTPTFSHYGPFKKDAQKKEYPEKVFARVTRSIISVKEVIKPCEKCSDTGEIFDQSDFPFMTICECHY